MKKHIVSTIGICILIIGTSFASGRNPQLIAQTKPLEVLKASGPDDSESESSFYIKAGLSVPVGRFGQDPSPTQSGAASFNGKDGTGAGLGYNFEIGGIYHLQKVELPANFKFGIDGGLSVSANNPDWTSLEMPGKFNNTPFYFFGFKIGPILTYQVNEKIIVDGFLKLNPVGTKAGVLDYSETSYKGRLGGNNEMTFGLKKSVGMNFRYKSFMLGAELNWGRIEYFIREEYSSGGGRDYKAKTPTSVVLLTTGIKF